MRALLLSAMAVCLVSCSDPKGEYAVTVDDDRYDLLAINMPPLLKSDAKSCIKIMDFVSDQKVGGSDAQQKMFNALTDFWQVVDVSMVSVENSAEVIPFGGDPKKTKSILPERIKTPTKVSHACGLYAGKIIPNIGLMTLKDGIEIALAEDPQVFTKMGLTNESVEAGVTAIVNRAENLTQTLSVEDRVDCAAIYQAAATADDSLAGNLTAWIAVLVATIEAGDLDSKKIRETSVFWNILATDGPSSVISSDGYQEQATKCDGWINDAIAKQAAE